MFISKLLLEDLVQSCARGRAWDLGVVSNPRVSTGPAGCLCVTLLCVGIWNKIDFKMTGLSIEPPTRRQLGQKIPFDPPVLCMLALCRTVRACASHARVACTCCACACSACSRCARLRFPCVHVQNVLMLYTSDRQKFGRLLYLRAERERESDLLGTTKGRSCHAVCVVTPP